MVNVKQQWNTVKNNTILLTYYPDLIFVSADRIEGTLKIRALYDQAVQKIVIDPTMKDKNNPFYIEDSYNIKIDFPSDLQRQAPSVYEINGRIIKAGKARGLMNPLDLHLFKDGRSCLCPQPLLFEYIRSGKISDLQIFLDELVTPYFYQQSFFERFGYWPVKNYSHGYPAIFEYYHRETSKLGKTNKHLVDLCSISLLSLSNLHKYLKPLVENKRGIKPTSKCFCGSEKKYKKCHRRKFTKEAREGFVKFMEDIRKI